MGVTAGHLPEMLVVIAIVAAIIWLIPVADSRWHRRLHRHL
jgi:Tfp pilus assembly protein FimT